MSCCHAFSLADVLYLSCYIFTGWSYQAVLLVPFSTRPIGCRTLRGVPWPAMRYWMY